MSALGSRTAGSVADAKVENSVGRVSGPVLILKGMPQAQFKATLMPELLGEFMGC